MIVDLAEFLVAPFRVTWRFRRILESTAINEIRTQYAGSILGSAWIVIGQLFLLTIYGITYVLIFKIRPADMTIYEYILYVFCGLTAFLPFSNALSAGAISLVSNRAVLLNTVFPAELIPFRSVLIASVTMPIGLSILALAVLILGKPSWSFLFVPVVMILQLMFVSGLVWALSLAALVVRDIQHIIQYAVMMLSIMTPIAYTPPMVPDGLKALIYINPLSYYVISFQYLIILNRLPDANILVPMVLLSILSFAAGYQLIHRAKGAFFDLA